jgi:molecular chaperone GrpE (heat shock protein)
LNWKFWNKADIKGENNLRQKSILNQPRKPAEQIEELHQQILEINTSTAGMIAWLPKIDDRLAHHSNRIDELEKQMSRTARIQYKSSQQLTEVISQIDERTTGLLEITAFNQKNTLIIDRLQQRLDSMAEALINCLDDIDMLLHSTGLQVDSNWRLLLEKWAEQILQALSEAGVIERKLAGQSFDPRWAEAIDTIERSIEVKSGIVNVTKSVPYEVAEVVRRCFVRADGSILRKGQVITYQDDYQEGELG